MKQKLSVTIDEEMLYNVDSMLHDGTFRNKSHLVEVALRKFWEKKNE